MIRPRLVCKYLVLAVVFSTLLWLLLPLLWVITPFPAENADAAFRALYNGRTYTRTYLTQRHWPIYVLQPRGDWIYGYQNPFYDDYFALDYTLNCKHESTYLTVGGTTLVLEELMESSEVLVGDGLEPPSVISGGRTINAIVSTANAGSMLISSWPAADVTALQQIIEPNLEVVELIVSVASISDSIGPVRAFVQIRSSHTLPDLPPSDYYSRDGYEPINGGSLFVLRFDRDSFGCLTDVYTTAESWGLSKTIDFRRALFYVMIPSASWIWTWLAPLLETLALAVVWAIKWGFALLAVLAMMWLCLGQPSLERILGAITRIRPAARLDRAIRIAEKVREEKLQNKRLRKKDLTITDAYRIWRGSREAVTGVRDFSIFRKHGDVEKGDET